MNESEDAFRLRKAREFLAHCRQAEDDARKALADAVERTNFAKVKFETLFIECELREAKRRLLLN